MQDTQGGFLPLCREAVGVFYSPSRQGNLYFDIVHVVCAYNNTDTVTAWNESRIERTQPRIMCATFNGNFCTTAHTTVRPRPCPVGWGCRIHWLYLCRGVRPSPTSVLNMTVNSLIARSQWCWGLGEYGAPIHCHFSQVHTGPRGSTR